jgi:lipoate-protein ligase A
VWPGRLESNEMEWRLLRSGGGIAEWNMALDEALWRSFPMVERPSLRIYRWSAPTLSIGYSQSVAEFDLEECARRGITFVRRPTGGRAVLHDLEVTYSLVHSTEEMGSIKDSHRQVGQALRLGLRRLGLAAQLVNQEQSVQNPSAACFEAPSSFELAIGGKKIAGSAQVRNHLTLLEHGSIPLELHPERLAAVLRPNGLSRKQLLSLLWERARGLRDFIAELRAEEIEQAIIAGFEEQFGVELIQDSPREEELQLAKELREGKYGDPGWNFRR